MNMRIRKARPRVLDVPSYEAARLHGKGGPRSCHDGWRILRTIFLEVARR